MRFPSGVTDQYLYFVAVDSTDLITRETGLSSFTVYRARNGAAAAAYTTPTIAEVSSTNMPGVYSLLLDEDMTIGSGNDSEEVVLHITQASMAPVTLKFELYRNIITAGETLTVSAGAVSSVTTTATATAVTTVNGLAAGVITAASIAADAITDAKVASDVTIASVTGAVGSVTGAVGSVTGNVGGNVVGSVASVTAGVTLAASAVQAIWDALTSALTTVGSVGKLMVDNINATVSSRLASASYTAPLDAAGTRAAVGLASANLDTQLADLPTNAELATALGTADDAVLTQVALVKAKTDLIPASPAATGDIPTADITAIKAKTDSLTFTLAGKVDANIEAVNGAAITGTGSTADPWGP